MSTIHIQSQTRSMVEDNVHPTTLPNIKAKCNQNNDFGLGGIGSQPHILKCWCAIVAFVTLTVKKLALPTIAAAEYNRAWYHRRHLGPSRFLFLFFTSGCLGVVGSRVGGSGGVSIGVGRTRCVWSHVVWSRVVWSRVVWSVVVWSRVV